jgi:hypothetical protein
MWRAARMAYQEALRVIAMRPQLLPFQFVCAARNKRVGCRQGIHVREQIALEIG